MKLVLLLISAAVLTSLISAQEMTTEPCKTYLCMCIESERLINFLAACPNPEANRCYANAECKIQADGKCGFTMDLSLNKCLEGSRFVEMPEEPVEAEIPRCRPTGCSGTICSDRNLISTCEWKPEHGCYRYAICRRKNGICEWDFTHRFNMCMRDLPLTIA